MSATLGDTIFLLTSMEFLLATALVVSSNDQFSSQLLCMSLLSVDCCSNSRKSGQASFLSLCTSHITIRETS